MDAALSRPPRSPLVPPGGVDLHERDMTATFSADVTLADAQRQLSSIGQWLPIDGDPALSLGQLVDQNSTGPLRLGYGAWRDLLLGVQFVNRRDELISAGGRTVKNVAGYDLTKFMVGGRGMFGRLVTLTTRTYRRPAGSIAIDLPGDPLKINELLPTPLRPQYAMLTPAGLRLGYLGDDRTLGYYRQHLPSLLPTAIVERSVDDDIADRCSQWCSFARPTFRASVPPANLLAFTQQLPVERWCADAAFGIVVGPAGASRDELWKLAESHQGRCALSDGPPMVSVEEANIIHALVEAFR